MGNQIFSRLFHSLSLSLSHPPTESAGRRALRSQRVQQAADRAEGRHGRADAQIQPSQSSHRADQARDQRQGSRCDVWAKVSTWFWLYCDIFTDRDACLFVVCLTDLVTEHFKLQRVNTDIHDLTRQVNSRLLQSSPFRSTWLETIALISLLCATGGLSSTTN